jgi:hypothetical protein
VYPVAVELARAHVGQIGVPHVVSPLGQEDPGGGPLGLVRLEATSGRSCA